ncbi:MAG TPA: hypothetical protein VLE73_01370 [Candidatus Saccharimonadales bacterium]|nr:hypothetical protein [Candidatus Saccharimonadales bacterium]
MSEQLFDVLHGVVHEDAAVAVVEAPTDLELAAAVNEALADVDAAVAAGEFRVSAATLDENLPQKSGVGNDVDGKHTNW